LPAAASKLSSRLAPPSTTTQAQQAQESAEAARKAELGSDEDEDELHRQRALDDFRDWNPRGHGNSKLKPCG